MSKAISLRAFTAAALLGAATIMAAPGAAQNSPFKEGVDVDGNGTLNAEEFIMAQGERVMAQRDANDDGLLSTAEWLGNSTGGFQQLTLDRFNADGDGFMSAAEIVEVFTWVFAQRDKNKDGKLSADETPNFLLNQ